MAARRLDVLLEQAAELVCGLQHLEGGRKGDFYWFLGESTVCLLKIRAATTAAANKIKITRYARDVSNDTAYDSRTYHMQTACFGDEVGVEAVDDEADVAAATSRSVSATSAVLLRLLLKLNMSAARLECVTIEHWGGCVVVNP